METYKYDIYDLGVMLKNIGHFGMDIFDDRLMLQKTIYLLKSFGFDLGYIFNWYIHGVYSPDLTKDGFELQEIYDEIPKLEIKYEPETAQTQFKKFIKFIVNKKSNSLELASSLCYWNNKGLSKNDTLKVVKQKKPHFNDHQYEVMWDELMSMGVVSP